jgi:hypothetical protein
MKTVPVVNINLEAALKLIAESDLAQGRNFQTAKEGKYFAAREERAEDYKWLEAKSDEYLKLAIAIDEQGK